MKASSVVLLLFFALIWKLTGKLPVFARICVVLFVAFFISLDQIRISIVERQLLKNACELNIYERPMCVRGYITADRGHVSAEYLERYDYDWIEESLSNTKSPKIAYRRFEKQPDGQVVKKEMEPLISSYLVGREEEGYPFFGAKVVVVNYFVRDLIAEKDIANFRDVNVSKRFFAGKGIYELFKENNKCSSRIRETEMIINRIEDYFFLGV